MSNRVSGVSVKDGRVVVVATPGGSSLGGVGAILGQCAGLPYQSPLSQQPNERPH